MIASVPRLRCLFFAAAVLLVDPAGARPREWTSADGTRKVEAEFVRFDGDKVVLDRADGKQFSMPLSSLSAADVRFLQALREKQPAAPAKPAAAPTSPVAVWDRTTAEKLVAEPPTEWSYRPGKPDTARSFSPKPLRLQATRLDPTVIFFAAPDAMKCVLMNVDPSRPIRDPLALHHAGNELQVYSLASGKMEKRVALPGAFCLRGVSPSAQTVALLSHTGDPVHVWSLVNGKAIGSFAPYTRTNVTSSDAVTTFFPDEAHLLTYDQSEKSVMTLWSLESGKAVWEMTLSAGGAQRPHISPDSRHVALFSYSRNRILLIETKTGKIVGALSPAVREVHKLFFSADGTELAGIAKKQNDTYVTLWDLNEGKETKTFSIPQVSLYPPVYGDGYVVLRGLDKKRDTYSLGDAARGQIVWNYQANAEMLGNHAGRFWFLSFGQPLSLHGVPLPDKQVRARLEKAPRAKPVVKSGDAVALEVNVAPPPPGFAVNDFSTEVRGSVEKGLAAAGYAPGDAAPVKFVVEVAEKQTGSQKMVLSKRSVTPGGPTIKLDPRDREIDVPIHEVTVTLRLTDRAGKVIWSRSHAYSNGDSGTRSMGIQADPLQTIRNEPWNRARLYFSRFSVPAEFLADGPTAAVGSSKLPF
jgi:hypothetical protein